MALISHLHVCTVVSAACSEMKPPYLQLNEGMTQLAFECHQLSIFTSSPSNTVKVKLIGVHQLVTRKNLELLPLLHTSN